jgi:hypothetical protein
MGSAFESQSLPLLPKDAQSPSHAHSPPSFAQQAMSSAQFQHSDEVVHSDEVAPSYVGAAADTGGDAVGARVPDEVVDSAASSTQRHHLL